MLRAGGCYRRTSYSQTTVSSVDAGDVLEEKWRAWVKQESFKRYVQWPIRTGFDGDPRDKIVRNTPDVLCG